MKRQSSQVLYSFEDCCGSAYRTGKVEAEKIIKALRNHDYGLPP